MENFWVGALAGVLATLVVMGAVWFVPRLRLATGRLTQQARVAWHTRDIASGDHSEPSSGRIPWLLRFEGTPEQFKNEFIWGKQQIDKLLVGNEQVRLERAEKEARRLRLIADKYWPRPEINHQYRTAVSYRLAAYAFGGGSNHWLDGSQDTALLYMSAGMCAHWAAHRFRYLNAFNTAANCYDESSRYFKEAVGIFGKHLDGDAPRLLQKAENEAGRAARRSIACRAAIGDLPDQ